VPCQRAQVRYACGSYRREPDKERVDTPAKCTLRTCKGTLHSQSLPSQKVHKSRVGIGRRRRGQQFFICRIATALTIVLLGGSGSGAFHQLPLGHAWHRALPLIPVLVLDVSENTLQMGSTLSRAVHGIVKRNAPTLHLNHYQNPVHQIKVDGDIYFVKFKYIGNCQTGSSG